ncbi:MAG TPA: glucosaminidase domain-containing protein [Chitinophagaceae bacterium]|nr:glucosaminidase domain-containing protein [Chitinophagaceae bacterium]
MLKLKIKLFIVLILIATTGRSQQSDAILKYIETYKDIAVAEMKRTGVPAAITLAQGIHESGAGQGKLVQMSNNHFGIKCKSNWTGETVKHNDDARGECFRKYTKAEDSYIDHSDFLKNSARYASLFQLDPEDYTSWANGLKAAGYATNPRYPQVLIKLIEDYQLQQYTFIVTGTTIQQTNPPAEPIKETDLPLDKKVKEPEVIPVDYPEGVFRIYDTKVVFVVKGTSFLSLARTYEIDLSKIFEFNDMKPVEMVEKDQLIYLQRKRKTGLNDFHIVKPGETLHEISQLNAIRLESLMELNWLKENEMPAPGEKLYLKTKAVAMPKLVLKENFSLAPVIK